MLVSTLVASDESEIHQRDMTVHYDKMHIYNTTSISCSTTYITSTHCSFNVHFLG